MFQAASPVTTTLFAWFLGLGLAAQEPAWTELRVPREIQTAVVAAPLPKGWAPAAKPHTYPLAAVDVSLGDPEAGGTPLDPDAEEPAGPLSTSRWNFVNPSENVWLTCSFRGTQETVRCQLPKGVSHLRVTSDPAQQTDGAGQVTKVEVQ